jgi:hypothetical protein
MKKISLKKHIIFCLSLAICGVLTAQFVVNTPATNPIQLTGVSANIKNKIEMCGQYVSTSTANSFVSIIATEEEPSPGVFEVHLYSSVNQLWSGFPGSYAIVSSHIITSAKNPHVCYSGDNSFYLVYESTGLGNIMIDRFDYNTTTGVINTTSLTYPVAFPQSIPGSASGINPRVCEKNYKHIPSIVYELNGDIIYATFRQPSVSAPFNWITQSIKSTIANNTTNPHIRHDMKDHADVNYYCDPALYLNVETFSHPDISNDYHISYVAQNSNSSTDYVNVIKLIPGNNDPNAAVNAQYPNSQISYHDISSFFNAPSSSTNAYRYPEISSNYSRTDDFGSTSFSPGVNNPYHLCLDRYAVVYEEILSPTANYVRHFGRQSYSEAIFHAHRNTFVLTNSCPPENPDCWEIDPHIFAIINNMDCQVKIPVNQINEDQETVVPAYEGVDVAQSIWTNTVNFPNDNFVISNNFINSGRKPMFLGPPALPLSYYGAPDFSSMVSMSGGPGGPFWHPTIGCNAFVPNTHFALLNTAIRPIGAALLNLSDNHLADIDGSAHAILDNNNDIYLKTKDFDNSNPFLPRLKQLSMSAKTDISIFPNPVSSGFILKSTATIGSPMQIEITDMMGRVVYHRDFIHKGANGFEIAELGKGLYNVKLTNEGKISHLKLVKE